MYRIALPIMALAFCMLFITGMESPAKTNDISVVRKASPSEEKAVKDIAIKVKKEKRPIKIAIVDTGLDRNDPRFSKVLCRQGHRNFVDGTQDTYDYNGHGTHVAGLIKKYAGESGYCIVILKYYDEKSTGLENVNRTLQAFRWAISIGIDIVNYSGGGPLFSEKEFLIIKKATKTLFVTAAGNEGEDTRILTNKYYPGSYELPNILVVGNARDNNMKVPSSNYGDPRIIWENGDNVNSTTPCRYARDGQQVCEGRMTGTSQATAVRTGKITKRALKYEDRKEVSQNLRDTRHSRTTGSSR